MLLFGPRLLLSPRRFAVVLSGSDQRPALWLIFAALTAALWPAVAVVAGNLLGAAIGALTAQEATIRASIGFTAVVGSALVLAPSTTLALGWLAERANERVVLARTGPAAMAMLWPAFAAGAVLALPPLAGWPPELGELVWFALAIFASALAVRKGAVPFLGIRRRFRVAFEVNAVAIFSLSFVLCAMAPAWMARSSLGTAVKILQNHTEPHPLPLPPEPRW